MKKSACHPEIYLDTTISKKRKKPNRVQIAIDQEYSHPTLNKVLVVNIRDGKHYYVDKSKLQRI